MNLCRFRFIIMEIKKNEAQEIAIHTVKGQMIIIACPGSGKTTTLIRRINYMVTEGGVSPDNILMITFTKAAAKEMEGRYKGRYGGNPGITFCTIHSLCLAILVKFAGFTPDCIISEWDVRDFFETAIRGMKDINDKAQFISDIIMDISVMKNNRIDAADFEQKCCQDQSLFLQLYTGYETYKDECGMIDFDDMLLNALSLIEENKEALAWMRKRYQYIQVDEYQDTNYVQRDLIYLLAGDDGNIAVVGDDDQSIYGFRGAKPEIMFQFKEHYPNVKEVYMSTNYRSAAGIIHHAAKLIEANQFRFKKDFLAFREDTGDFTVCTSEKRQSELEDVVKKIKGLVDSGVEPEDIAVLYRTNSQASAVAGECLANGLPFMSNEPIMSKYSHWIYRDIIAYHQMATGNGRNIDFIQTLNHPNRFLNLHELTCNGPDKAAMLDAVKKIHCEEWKRTKMIDNINTYFYFLKYLSALSPLKTIKAMEGVGGYKKYIHDYADYRNMDESELLDVWEEYKTDIQKCGDDWDAWNKYVIRYNEAIKSAQKNKTGIMLSTMHRSKGLEWKYVFVIDCIESICPFAKAETEADFEEERRLFYVAMTRAKDNLYLYTYKKRGSKSVKPSPYLSEMMDASGTGSIDDLIRKVGNGGLLTAEERNIIRKALLMYKNAPAGA